MDKEKLADTFQVQRLTRALIKIYYHWDSQMLQYAVAVGVVLLMRVCYNILLTLLQVLLMCEHTHDSQMSNTSLERLSSGIVSFPSSCDGWRHGLSKSNEIQ